ncbi:MAG: hypothetical protein Kow0056_10000 [Coriobacteriia bacterium]
MKYARIVNNFVHDLATGTWAASILVLWVLSDRAQGMPAETMSAVTDAGRAVFALCVAALLLIFATGGIRLRYWKEQAEDGAVEEKRRALLVKHVAFLVVYSAGTYVAWLLIPGQP